MRILYIAPLPPPLGGHSLMAKVLYDHLYSKHKVTAVNFNKESFVEGFSGFKRIFEVLDVLDKVRKNQKHADVIYLTISESFLGNIKDILIYLLCYRKLSSFYIHLHGGSIKRLLWDKYPFLFKINKWLIKKLAGIIISGNSHMDVFGGYVDHNKIHKVPNFALDYLFVNEEWIHKKFSQIEKIKVLYISNMIEKKGYFELANAYIRLETEYQMQIEIDFAGRFDLETQKKSFLNFIENYPNMRYHGVVDNEKKKNLFDGAHVFALPTAFFEGQPVSILEAYASGCFVITTGQSGILDIFTDKINGYQFADPSANSIKLVLEELLKSKSILKSITIQNLGIANQKYRKQIYNDSLATILEVKALNNQN